MEHHVGTWVLDESVNFEGYLQITGFPAEHIPLALAAKPTLAITKNGNVMVTVLEVNGDKKTSTVDLCGGETVNDGFAFETKSTAKVDGDKLIIDVKFPDPTKKPLVLTQEVLGDRLTQTIDVNKGEVICKRIYKKL